MYKGQVTPEMEAKADKYFEAHKNYKKASENYDEYRTNLLEEEAWDAGERGSDNYFIQGEDLYSQFRHMPASEL
jgi:hypothetical protein